MGEPPIKNPRVEVPEENPKESFKTGHEIKEWEDIDFKFSEVAKTTTFVDKTLLMMLLIRPKDKQQNTLKRVQVIAPHGFGKSVNISMVKKFFEIEVDLEGEPKMSMKYDDKIKVWLENPEKTANFKFFSENNFNIFNCLCVTEHTIEEQTTGKCGQHPVVFLSLKNLNSATLEDFMSSCKSFLNGVFAQHAYLGTSKYLEESERDDFLNYINSSLSQQEMCDALKMLIEYIHKHFSKRVFVLIDDYDAPVIQLINGSNATEEHIKQIITFVETLATSLMVANQNVLGGLICSSLSTFFPARFGHNMEVRPFLENHKFSSYFGFTEYEVNKLLKRPQFNGFNQKNALDYCSGYSSSKPTRIYCISSLLSFLRKWSDEQSLHSPYQKYLSDGYWFRNHGIPMLNKVFGVGQIREKIRKLLSDDCCDISLKDKKLTSDNIIRLKSIVNEYSILPFSGQDDLFVLYLKDCGYLTVTQKNGFVYTLKIPNGIIRAEIGRNFYDQEYYQQKYNFAPVKITSYCNALLSLDANRPETVKELANSIKRIYSEDVLLPKDHEEFKAPLTAFAIGMQTVLVNADMHCQSEGNDKLDLLLYRENDKSAIIIAFKWGYGEKAINGLEHIFKKQYYKAFELFDIRHKTYVGLHSSESKEVNICAAATSSEKWDDEVQNLITYQSEN